MILLHSVFRGVIALITNNVYQGVLKGACNFRPRDNPIHAALKVLEPLFHLVAIIETTEKSRLDGSVPDSGVNGYSNVSL